MKIVVLIYASDAYAAKGTNPLQKHVVSDPTRLQTLTQEAAKVSLEVRCETSNGTKLPSVSAALFLFKEEANAVS